MLSFRSSDVTSVVSLRHEEGRLGYNLCGSLPLRTGNNTMKRLHAWIWLVLLPAMAWGYTKDPQSGLLFNVKSPVVSLPLDAEKYQGVTTALWVAPEDLPDRKHFSNANMAFVELLNFASDGKVLTYRLEEDACEEVFVVLEGVVKIIAGAEELLAQPKDLVFVPPGVDRALSVQSGGEARVVRARWKEKGRSVVSGKSAFLTGERVRPLHPTGGLGYLTVSPSARQKGVPVSITGYGASHVNASNSLLLYPADISSGRPFKANTQLARIGLSQYGAEGGTQWHFHPDREQCFVILSGKGLVEMGANTVEVEPGDVLFAPRHVGHGYKTTGSDPFTFLELEWGRN